MVTHPTLDFYAPPRRAPSYYPSRSSDSPHHTLTKPDASLPRKSFVPRVLPEGNSVGQNQGQVADSVVPQTLQCARSTPDRGGTAARGTTEAAPRARAKEEARHPGATRPRGLSAGPNKHMTK